MDINKIIEWWKETDNSQVELENELEFHNIDLSVNEFLKLTQENK
jgi:hypothetical protein